jgi:hypothetical protein
MNEKGGIAETLKAAKELAEAVPVYQDAVQPVAKELGESLKPAGRDVGESVVAVTGAIKLALTPLRGLLWGWQQVEEIVLPELGRRFRDKLHRLVPPEPTVAGPALESLRFAGSQPALREMYVNLLATAMDKETATKAHPSFAEIIRQLTPDEARVVRLLYTTGGVDVSGTWDDLSDRIRVMVGEAAGCEHPELIEVYLGNLHRIGFYFGLRMRNQQSGHPDTTTHKVELMLFGRQFCEACVVTAP